MNLSSGLLALRYVLRLVLGPIPSTFAWIRAVGHLVDISVRLSAFPFLYMYMLASLLSWIRRGMTMQIAWLPGMLVSLPGMLRAGPFDMQDASTSIDSLLT